MKKSILQKPPLHLTRHQNLTERASSFLSNKHLTHDQSASARLNHYQQRCRYRKNHISYSKYAYGFPLRKFDHTSSCFSTLIDNEDEQKHEHHVLEGNGIEGDNHSFSEDSGDTYHLMIKDSEETFDNDEVSKSQSSFYLSGNDNDSSSLLSLLSNDDDDETDLFVSDEDNDSVNSISTTVSTDASATKDDGSKKHRKKKKKKKRMKQPPKSNIIPKIPAQQTRTNAEALFDSIAPHVDEEILNMILAKMQEFASTMEEEVKNSTKPKSKKKNAPINLAEYKTIIGKVNAFFSMEKRKGGNKQYSKNAAYLKSQPWIKSLIAQFFSGTVGDSNISTSVSSADKFDESNTKIRDQKPAPLSMDLIWRDPTFPPNINRKKRKEFILTLMHAREMSLESPLLWSFNQRRKIRRKSRDDSHELKIREAHYEKSAKELEEEAKAMASILSFRLPIEAHDELLSLFKDYASNVADMIVQAGFDNDDNSGDNNDFDADTQGTEDSKHVEIMKMFFPNLKRRTGFHVHFVAAELADFFYVDLPDQVRDAGGELDFSGSAAELPLVPMGTSDSRINESWNEWKSFRGELVNGFLSSQHMYVRLHSAMKSGGIDRKPKMKKSKKDDTKEEEVKRIMIKYSNDAHKRTEELLQELDRLRTTEDGELVGDSPGAMNRVGRGPKGVNLRFECHMLHAKFGPFSSSNTAFAADLDKYQKDVTEEISPGIAERLPDTNRTIFVDNLPIDISREELEYLYSRCGAVESIEIFNLRPDLDPGELSEKEMNLRKKRNRMSGVKAATQRRNRKSPVYAKIKFKDEDGFRTATIDMLRIFGMVIRQHAVRSHPARSFHKLFLENIPTGKFAMDLQEKLSNALYPDMYISLELGQHINSQPKSCEITFPTFEVSHYAYEQLQTMQFEESACSLHWQRTPDDAMSYWTREIGPNA